MGPRTPRDRKGPLVPNPGTPGRAHDPTARPSGRATRSYAVTLGLAALLGACGQPTHSSPDDSIAPTVSVPVQPTITAETPSDDAVDPSETTAPSDGGLFDASSSLTWITCAPTGGSWSFSGTLTNSDSEEHTFTVGVFVVKVSDSSEVAGKEIDVTLAAGATAPVSIKNFHTGPKAGVECLSGVTVKGR